MGARCGKAGQRYRTALWRRESRPCPRHTCGKYPIPRIQGDTGRQSGRRGRCPTRFAIYATRCCRPPAGAADYQQQQYAVRHQRRYSCTVFRKYHQRHNGRCCRCRTRPHGANCAGDGLNRLFLCYAMLKFVQFYVNGELRWISRQSLESWKNWGN